MKQKTWNAPAFGMAFLSSLVLFSFWLTASGLLYVNMNHAPHLAIYNHAVSGIFMAIMASQAFLSMRLHFIANKENATAKPWTILILHMAFCITLGLNGICFLTADMEILLFAPIKQQLAN